MKTEGTEQVREKLLELYRYVESHIENDTNLFDILVFMWEGYDIEERLQIYLNPNGTINELAVQYDICCYYDGPSGGTSYLGDPTGYPTNVEEIVEADMEGYVQELKEREQK